MLHVKMSKKILLIAFFNPKALGVKYIAEALKRAGYTPHVLYFKEYNSICPSEISDTELTLLSQLIGKINPDFIGLSVMSSLHLDSIIRVHNFIGSKFDRPIIWGGVFSTLFPEKCLTYADFVVCGEGEEAIVELIDTLIKNGDISGIQNLAFKKKDGSVVINPVRPLIQDLDSLGYPGIGGENIYYIRNNRLSCGDPQLKSLTYETTASRGCPFTCSYCSSVNLKRIYSGKGKFVRFRSVDSIIQELKEAKRAVRNLRLIHFWDEIFSDEQGWIEEFKDRYKREVNIPFTIWSHPLKISERIMGNLVEAGLHHAVVGIQSGSPRVRKDVFHRSETQEQIIESSRILSKCRVPLVSYDFMLQHPFETLQDLVDTFELCLRLEPPFELNLHGLNFLPGTDIVDMAVSKGLMPREEMEKIMYSTMREQYDMYWGAAKGMDSNRAVWMALIYLTQFQSLRPLVRMLADRYKRGKDSGESIIFALRKIYGNIFRMKSVLNKAKLLVK